MPKFSDDQMTLGALIEALSKCPSEHTVNFGFGNYHPHGLASYRGFYEDLAIGYTEDTMPPTVAELLKELRAALDADFTGYKGGTYSMHEDTALWVANVGDSTSTIIVGVDVHDYSVILQTRGIVV